MKLTSDDWKALDIIKGTLAGKAAHPTQRDWCYVHKAHLERLVALIEREARPA